MHAYEVYPCEMHARKMHAHEIHAREMHAREVHAHETLTNGGAVVDLSRMAPPRRLNDYIDPP